MATINQLTKQIDTATKRVSGFEKKIAMYQTKVDKWFVTFSLSHSDLVAEGHGFYSLTAEARERVDWNTSYKVASDYEYLKRNERELEYELRHIARLQSEKAALVAKQEAEEKAFNYGLSATLTEALASFREQWFTRMQDWHRRHYACIHRNLEGARIQYARAKSLSHYFFFNRNHARLYNNLQAYMHEMTVIIMDEAARYDNVEDYMERVQKELEREWESGLRKLTTKCQAFDIDESRLQVSGVDMTDKGFEVWITDGKPRRVYARIIWAAEYSDIVCPHTRYIVTEKKL